MVERIRFLTNKILGGWNASWANQSIFYTVGFASPSHFTKNTLHISIFSSLLIGTCLDCYKCDYDSSMSSAQRTCNSSNVETCTGLLDTHCGAQVKVKNGTTYYKKACISSVVCASPSAYCTGQMTVSGYTKCKVECCQSNKCNDEFPSLSGGSGVDQVDVGQAVFVASLLAVILFA